MATAAFPYEPQEHRPLAQRASRFATVVGLHAGLIACLMNAQERTPREPDVVRLEMYTIEAPPPSLPEARKSVATPPTPLPALAKLVQRRPQAPALAAAPGVETASTASTAASASAPRNEAGFAAAPGPAPAQTPVAVQGPRFDADYLQNPAPAYPPISRRKREEGKVLLQVRVSTAGLPEQIQVKQTSGFPRLDEAAVDTVQRWRFVPARRGEETVAENVIVPIVFRLEG